jgi:hypothetical protein
MMQLGIAVPATAGLEQARVVRRDALQERFHRPLGATFCGYAGFATLSAVPVTT